ncbi:MAG: hypothetical protein Q7R60_00730 [bacterium]|nr:hypothetical protein [bacterium]
MAEGLLPKVDDGEGPIKGPEYELAVKAIGAVATYEAMVESARLQAIQTVADEIASRIEEFNPRLADPKYRFGVAECLVTITPQLQRYIEGHNRTGRYLWPLGFKSTDTEEEGSLDGVTKFAEALIIVAKTYDMEIVGKFNKKSLAVEPESDAVEVVQGFYEPTDWERQENAASARRLGEMLRGGIHWKDYQGGSGPS